MNLAMDTRVRRSALLACGRRGEQRQEGSPTRKSRRIFERRKALKGESHERPDSKKSGGVMESKASRELEL
jgi:hypothetical protein